VLAIDSVSDYEHEHHFIEHEHASCGALFDVRKAGILSGCGVLRFPTGGVALLTPQLCARIPIGMK
jgi:hypothetical protein